MHRYAVYCLVRYGHSNVWPRLEQRTRRMWNSGTCTDSRGAREPRRRSVWSRGHEGTRPAKDRRVKRTLEQCRYSGKTYRKWGRVSTRPAAITSALTLSGMINDNERSDANERDERQARGRCLEKTRSWVIGPVRRSTNESWFVWRHAEVMASLVTVDGDSNDCSCRRRLAVTCTRRTCLRQNDIKIYFCVTFMFNGYGYGLIISVFDWKAMLK